MSEERILITGATGFLGSALVRELLNQESVKSKKHLLFTIARNDLKNLHISHSLINLENFSEVAAHLEKIRPTQVYHLSGLSRVSNSISMKDYFFANYLQTRNLVDALGKIPGKVKLLLSSSVHVYGNQKGCIEESALVHPESTYAFSKYLSEECLKLLVKSNDGFRAVAARLSSCFGPGQASGFVVSDFAQKVREAKLKNLRKIKTGPLNSFRQFTDYRDVARAFRLMMEQDQKVPFDIYNLASPQKTSIQVLLNEFFHLAEVKLEVESLDSGENPFLGLDISTSKFVSQWPDFHFRSLNQTLSEIWETNLKTPS